MGLSDCAIGGTCGELETVSLGVLTVVSTRVIEFSDEATGFHVVIVVNGANALLCSGSVGNELVSDTNIGFEKLLLLEVATIGLVSLGFAVPSTAKVVAIFSDVNIFVGSRSLIKT